MALIYNFLSASKRSQLTLPPWVFVALVHKFLQFENSGYEINNNIQSLQLELNSTFGDNATNKLQVGYTHFDDYRDALSSPIPAITIQDGAGSNYIIAGHEPFSINNRLDQKVFQVTNNFNYFVGNHTFTVGASFEKFQFDNSFNLGAYGYDENGDFVQEIGAFCSLPKLAEFYDDINDGSMAIAIANAEALFTNSNAAGEGNDGGWALAETNVGQFSFYVQDDWSVTPDFKLTYGVRFDKPLYFDTQDKIQENIARKHLLLTLPFLFQSANRSRNL
ncbi:TonB-dependent receptor, partial [Winogradskyella maritima]|nr:TonB-dependent receptor [Winogradskyella maritima]